MAEVGGQPGNRNSAKGRKWAEALQRALARYADPARMIEAGQALDKIAEKVVASAVKGDPIAITEIANRLDGKPAQGITLSGDDDNPVKAHHKVEFIGSRSVTGET